MSSEPKWTLRHRMLREVAADTIARGLLTRDARHVGGGVMQRLSAGETAALDWLDESGLVADGEAGSVLTDAGRDLLVRWDAEVAAIVRLHGQPGDAP